MRGRHMASPEFSIVVKTLERPEALRRLLASIRQFYPAAPILVADDSKEADPGLVEPYTDVGYEHYGHDAGIGHCLNETMKKVETPLVVLVDDDFVFTEQTTLEGMTVWVEADVFDVAGGHIWNSRSKGRQRFIGHFHGPHDGVLHVQQIPDSAETPVKVDLICNFFAAKIETVRDIGWDEDLKVARHLDWYLRAREKGARIGYVGGCVVDHAWMSTPQYGKYRWERMERYQQMFLRKWDLERVTGLGEWKRQ